MLLGLVVEDRLEITNCFPFPQHTEDDADFDEGKAVDCLAQCVLAVCTNDVSSFLSVTVISYWVNLNLVF